LSTAFENLSDDEKSARLLDYVHGRTSQAEQNEIEAIILSDKVAAEELAYYQGLANAADPVAPSPDHEFGWAKLSKSIDQETLQPSASPLAANDNFKMWKVATFALAFVTLLQAAFIFTPVQPTQPQEPIYVPVTQEALFAVQVIFVDTTTSVKIRNLLNEIDGEIVSGPSALGLYDVQFSSEELRRAGLELLREQPDIIKSVTLK
jgi:hypothetical protein